jgi:hypothetical protein
MKEDINDKADIAALLCNDSIKGLFEHYDK